MKKQAVIFSFVIASLLSCEKKFCSNTDFSVAVNDKPWDAYIRSCYLDLASHGTNNTFDIYVYEANPIHDNYKDILSLLKIPFEEGIFILKSIGQHHSILTEFSVHEVEYGTATQNYEVIDDGDSFVNVEEIDFENKTFKISFHLKMTVNNPDGIVYNSSYPRDIIFSEGQAEGQFKE